jgi:hypothetical protein
MKNTNIFQFLTKKFIVKYLTIKFSYDKTKQNLINVIH